MFEKTAYQCPRCQSEFRQEFEETDLFTCDICGRRFRVLLDKQSGAAAFFEQQSKEIPEPLYLPKGSVRSLVAIAMALSCWVLIFAGRDAPSYLLSLLLTIIAYYFGFRTKVKAAESRIYDPAFKVSRPLFLPGGFVRAILILGFSASLIFLLTRGKLSEAHIEFFLILFGLIAGYVFGRIWIRMEGGAAYVLVNHAKGAVVLLVAAYLVYLFVSGLYAETPPLHASVLCAVLSFYYGSRS